MRVSLLRWSCALTLSASLCAVSSASLAATQLTVLLDWFTNPDHAQLVIARELGYFEEAGLEVEMIEPTDPSLPPKMVAAGNADIAITYQPQLHQQVAEGLPLSRFGTLVSTPLSSLVVLDEGPVQAIADLKGRKVGFSVGGFEEIVLAAMLETHGLTLDDVTLVNVNFSLSPSLITGQVDAVIGAYRNFELNQMDIEGHPGRAFYPEEEGVPIYDELILVAANDNRDNPALGQFITAIERATTYIINHPDDAWELFAQSSPDTLDNELNRRAWADTLPRLALRPGAIDTRRYDAFAQFMVERALIDEAADIDSYTVVVE